MTDPTFDLKGTNLYLIGMMGAGKSTAGQLLAQRLGYQFFDTDAVITQAAGCSISQIFAESGEAVFRNLETQVLSQLAAHKRLVVATGGGIVLERMNWSHLRHGLIVWLNPTLETLWQRLQADTTRPLLQDSNPRQTLEQLLMQRQPLYQQADLCIEITPEHDA
ncbi:MAG TPA: shikimate kinase, partial [Stenomitos sp.]